MLYSFKIDTNIYEMNGTIIQINYIDDRESKLFDLAHFFFQTSI